MANEQDRRWRERMRRDDDDRRYGEQHAGQHAGRGWREGSEWRNRDRGGEWSSAGGSRAYGGRGGWGDRDRSDRPSSSAWEQSGWDDPGRGDMRRREMGQDLESRGDDYGREFSRNFPGRDMGQTGRNWGDRRQARDYAGSMRAGEMGAEMGRDRSSSYGGSRYRSAGSGGRSGMGYGGGASGPPTRRPSEYDQYTGMTSEPGFGAGYGAVGPRRTAGGGYGYGGEHDWGGRGENERGFWDKATDEVSSWSGDDEAERRREMDRGHTGRGPRNYARSDSRIHEDVCDRLTENPMIDASEVEVSVSDREVTLTGTVHSREDKRRAEDLAEDVSGVTHVQNNLRVQRREPGSHVQSTLDSFSNATAGGFAEKGGSTMSSRTHNETGTSGAGSSTTASGTASDSKKTTGSSPGVMRPDPSTSSTKGA